MNHFAKIAAHLAEENLDAVLLTGEANRFYASGFHSTGGDGVAVVTRSGSYYFTDSRYIEAAEAQVEDAAIGMTDREKPYSAWINEAIALSGIQTMGFEDDAMTVAEFRMYEEKLHCRLVPASDFLHRLRQVKDGEEIGRLIDAQRIAEGALEQILREIDFFLERYPLQRGLYLCYDRIAMFQTDNPAFRVTFDTNIRGRRTDMGLENGAYGMKLLPDDYYLMETKILDASPLWFTRILSELSIYTTSFSKYGNIYKMERGAFDVEALMRHRLENWEKTGGFVNV